ASTVPWGERGSAAEEKMTSNQVLGKTRQGQITDVVEKRMASRLGGMSQDAATRLVHCSLPMSSLWLSVLPIDPEMELKDEEYRQALRLRLGMGPVDYNWTCGCGQLIRGDHLQVCSTMRKEVTGRRHDHIVNCLRNLGVLIGVFVKREPKVVCPYQE